MLLFFRITEGLYLIDITIINGSCRVNRLSPESASMKAFPRLNSSVPASFAEIIIAAEFTLRRRHETSQAAMDPGIPLVAASMLTDSDYLKPPVWSLSMSGCVRPFTSLSLHEPTYE